MRTPIPDYLIEVLDGCRANSGGAVADYIPQLAAAEPERLAVALSSVDGVIYHAGDTDVEFTIQSISKPFVYALALADRGFDSVLEKVGVEPSGEAFNELSLEEGSGRPLNPMINAGALATHALLATDGGQSTTERAIAGLVAFAGRELTVDEAVFESEMATSDRSLAIAYMLRSHGVLEHDPAEVVRGYIRQCSVRVTAGDIAVMAATLANGGQNPVSGEHIVAPGIVRQVLSVMTTCGMYDAAGDWVTNVGIPAKSGVSGGILGALPGQVGIAAFSPRLDTHGNSVRGVTICERLSADMGLHLMGVAPPAHAALRDPHAVAVDEESISVYELQGSIQFAGAERVLRELDTSAPETEQVAIDFSQVHSINDVARRMLLEGVRRLALDGYTVTLIDPTGIMPDPDAGSGVRPRVVDSLAELSSDP